MRNFMVTASDAVAKQNLTISFPIDLGLSIRYLILFLLSHILSSMECIIGTEMEYFVEGRIQRNLSHDVLCPACGIDPRPARELIKTIPARAS